MGIPAVSFNAPPSLTRRDMAMGFGAAAAAMIQVGPAFAESAQEKKQREKDELAKTLATFAKTTQEDKDDRARLTGSNIYNPLATRSTASTSASARKSTDPNGCSEECKAKRLAKFGY